MIWRVTFGPSDLKWDIEADSEEQAINIMKRETNGEGFAFFRWRCLSAERFVFGWCDCGACASNWLKDWREGIR